MAAVATFLLERLMVDCWYHQLGLVSVGLIRGG
jgi:hypothetical protein